MTPTEIITARLILREPRLGDAEAQHAAVFSDADAMRFIGDGTTRSIDKVRDSIGKKQASLAEHGVTLFTLIERDTEAIVGDCGVLPIDWEGPGFELAYRLAPNVWGRGYATEAGAAALAHAWRTTTLDEIEAVTDMGNDASQRVLAKLNFEDLGTTTEYYYGEQLRSYSIRSPR